MVKEIRTVVALSMNYWKEAQKNYFVVILVRVHQRSRINRIYISPISYISKQMIDRQIDRQIDDRQMIDRQIDNRQIDRQMIDDKQIGQRADGISYSSSPKVLKSGSMSLLTVLFQDCIGYSRSRIQSFFTCVCVCMCMCIYIYIQRERERERERNLLASQLTRDFINIFIYLV